MKRIFFLPALFVSGLLLGFASCSDDDDNGGNKGNETIQVDTTYTYGELAELQNALVKVDSAGNFLQRVRGVHLATDGADTTVVSIGVDNLAEAKEVFASLFADTTTINADTTLATLVTRPGSARLSTAGTGNGVVATATFDVPQLKYTSRINFMRHEAWPENARSTSRYKQYVKYKFKAWSTTDGTIGGWLDYAEPTVPWVDPNEELPFVCIRECQDGQPALLVAITPTKYELAVRSMRLHELSVNIATKSQAKEISEILRGPNWNNFYECFHIDGQYLLSNNDKTEYWYRGSGRKNHTIALKTGKFDTYWWTSPKLQFVLCIESLATE